LLVEVFTDEGIGTMVYSPRPASLGSPGRGGPEQNGQK
jgi:hypothetical protein